MAKRKFKVHKSGGDQFIPLGYSMAHSAAWRSLSGSAVKVWVELRSRYNGGNNGKLSLSLDEGARLLGLGKATIARALDELIAKGFIELKVLGYWYGRKASEYAVTDRSCQGAHATNAWLRYKPPPKPLSVSKRARNSVLGSDVGHIEAMTEPLQHRRN